MCCTQYLKQRKDTVRCIVQSLTDDQNGDLFEELHRSNVRVIEHDDDSDDDEVRVRPKMENPVMYVLSVSWMSCTLHHRTRRRTRGSPIRSRQTPPRRHRAAAVTTFCASWCVLRADGDSLFLLPA
jgi:hypothetical protein